MEKNLEQESVHDTRGRRIISVAKAKRELISSYIISLIITSMIRMVVGYIVEPSMEIGERTMFTREPSASLVSTIGED